MNQQQGSVPTNHYSDYRDDEIDLMELFAVLWKGKSLIVGCALIALVLGYAYITVKPSIYSVESKLAKPHAMDLAFTQLEILKLEPGDGAAGKSIRTLYTPDEVFEQVAQALKSRTYQKEFILQLPTDEIGESIDFEWFFRTFKVAREKQGKQLTGVLSVSMACEDRELCRFLIDEYIGYIRSQGSKGLMDKMLALLDSESHKTRQKAVYLKGVHQQTISDRLAALNSQIEVAKGLGWAAPNIEILSSDKRVSRYYEGYKLLELEREGLKKQLDNDAFVSGLREQQRKLDRIELEREWINQYGDEISVVNVVDQAYSSPNPVAPKKQLILALSVVLGGMIGVFAVFIRQGVRSYRARAVG